MEHLESAGAFGVHHQNLKTFETHFPQLNIVARGNQVNLRGSEFDISLFEEKFEQMLKLIRRFGAITELQLEGIFSGDSVQTEKTAAAENMGPQGDIILYGNHAKVIRAKTPNQRKMVSLMQNNDILFAIGPAGTGKTYTAVALAVKALKNKEIKRIILARPAVEAGENLGFLPGDLKEKIDPYLRPLYDALDDMIPADKLKSYIETRVIEIAPMAFMRGRTLDNAYVILDEAQNATDLQLKMFLTRMGPNAKFIITGDLTQIDLPKKSMSGLVKAVKILEGIKGIEFAYLTFEDVVRHRLVKNIIKAYDKSVDNLMDQSTTPKS
ncbi:MAG: PhoH family protein [Bacteroidia bacterium]|nr:PhoH family protein [Bacteroidia bacterium]